MKVRKTGSRISLGHMKPRSLAGKSAHVCLLSLSVFLSTLFGNTSGLAAPQKHGRPSPSQRRVGRVQMGIDVLEAEKFAPLKGKHVGLITNHTGVDFQGKTTIEALAHAPGVQLVALFSPEHGIAGHSDEKIVSSTAPSTGLPLC